MAAGSPYRPRGKASDGKRVQLRCPTEGCDFRTRRQLCVHCGGGGVCPDHRVELVRARPRRRP